MPKSLPPLPVPILPRHLPHPTHQILIHRQPLQPHRPARMDLIRADPYLRAESKAHPVRHAGAGVPEHAGRVDAALEFRGSGGGGGDDGIGVVGGVGVDVGDGEGDGGW